MPNSLTTTEQVLAGRHLALPWVRSVAALNSRNASRITWHSHTAVECLYLLDGGTEYEFENRNAVVLSGGHFLLIPARTRHRGLHDIRRPSKLCSIQLQFSNKQRHTNMPFTREELDWIRQQYFASSLAAYPMNSELKRLTKVFVEQLRQASTLSFPARASMRLLVCEILLDTAKQLTAAQPVPTPHAVHATMHYMEESYAEPIAMNDLANVASMSRSRLFQAFKATTGMTPNDYLQRLRVAKAAQMLKTSSRSITDIALSCGFSTSQYFCYVFGKYHNVSPRIFREQEKRR